MGSKAKYTSTYRRSISIFSFPDSYKLSQSKSIIVYVTVPGDLVGLPRVDHIHRLSSPNFPQSSNSSCQTSYYGSDRRYSSLLKRRYSNPFSFLACLWRNKSRLQSRYVCFPGCPVPVAHGLLTKMSLRWREHQFEDIKTTATKIFLQWSNFNGNELSFQHFLLINFWGLSKLSFGTFLEMVSSLKIWLVPCSSEEKLTVKVA